MDESGLGVLELDVSNGGGVVEVEVVSLLICGVVSVDPAVASLAEEVVLEL